MLMVGPRGALSVGPAVSTTEVEDDVDGGPPRALPVGLAASTTEVEDDVDGGPPRGATGRSNSVWHRVLKTTLMAGPPGGRCQQV
jgi:hypothetical protein